MEIKVLYNMGRAVSLITSAILQMAIIFYLTEKTESAMVLSMASLVGFLPYAVYKLYSKSSSCGIAIVCPMMTDIRKLDSK